VSVRRIRTGLVGKLVHYEDACVFEQLQSCCVQRESPQTAQVATKRSDKAPMRSTGVLGRAARSTWLIVALLVLFF
jgi:hypothetical protein